MLRRFAGALAIPPQSLGLTPPDSVEPGDTPTPAYRAVLPLSGPNLSGEFQPEGGEDPVRRRELLARAAGLAGAAALGLPAATRPEAPSDPGGHLDNLLYGSASAEPVSLTTLRTHHSPGSCLFPDRPL